jgi:hypothetical protein
MRAAVLLLLVGACASAPPAAPPQAAAPAAAPVGGEDPDAYAAVSEFFGKKRPHVSQCYANARQNAQIDDKARGFVALSMTVLPSGQAQDVKVSRTTLAAPAVEECIVGLVSRWTLPAPAQPIAFSFTYDFKPE